MSDRTDRSLLSLRPLAISQSLLSRSDGSSQFSFGNVTVLTSVTGPTEVRLREELVDRSTLEFNVVPLVGLGGPHLKSVQHSIETLFSPLILSNLYPRSLIQITTQTINSPSTLYSRPFTTTLDDQEDDDEQRISTTRTSRRTRTKSKGQSGAGEQAARINSISLALVDSGVQLKGLLVAVAVAFLPLTTTEDDDEEEEAEEEMVLDPTVFEEERAKSTHVLTVSFGHGIGATRGEIVGIESIGRFTQDQLFDAQDLALKATETILAFMRKSIEAKYGVESTSSSSTPSTTTRGATNTKTKGGGGGDIKMCQAEEGREMSDPEEEDEDEVMI